MNKRLNILATVLLLLLAAPMAQASDDMDLLQDLDTAMQTEQVKVAEEKDASFPAQLKRNGEFVVRLRGYHTLQGADSPKVTADQNYDIPQDSKDDYGEIRASFGSSYENEHVRMAASGWLEHGTQDDTYSSNVGFWQDDDRRRNILEINEAYVTVLGDRADLTLGKRLIRNTLAPAFSPTDRYSSIDLNDPLDPRRLGTWQAALEGDAIDVSWTAAVLPVFQAPRTPSPESRWIANSNTDADLSAHFGTAYGTASSFYSAVREELFFFESLLYGGSGFTNWLDETLNELYGYVAAQSPQITVEHDVPEPGSIETTGVFGQAKTTVGDYDFLASAYRGPSLYPVLRVDLDRSANTANLIVEHPTVNQFSGGVSTPWKGIVWHAETIYSHSEAGKDDSYVQYAVGGTYSEEAMAKALGLWRIDVGLQYDSEWITDTQDAGGYAISSNKLRVGKNDLIPAITIHCTEDVRLQYLAVLELDHGASLNRFGVGWDITENLASEISLELFDGPRQSYFGWWRDQDRVVGTLTYTF